MAALVSLCDIESVWTGELRSWTLAHAGSAETNDLVVCRSLQDTILVVPPYPYSIEEVLQDVLLED